MVVVVVVCVEVVGVTTSEGFPVSIQAIYRTQKLKAAGL